MLVLSLVLAGLIGLSLGLLGGGGSILTVPILVYVAGFGAKQSIALSLAVVGLTSLTGAWRHWSAGNLNVAVALLFGSVAMAGTFAGARLSVFFSGSFQLLLFSVIMLLAAFFMFRGRKGPDDAEGDAFNLKRVSSVALTALLGLGVGVVTGLVGVGGGFMIVPALVLLVNVSMKQAVGTSLLIIAMNTLTGFLGYLDQVDVPWLYLGGFTAMATIGIVIGAHLIRYIAQSTLKKAFAVFLLLMGALIFYQNLNALL